MLLKCVIWTNRALTVEFVENLRNISLGLDGVNESVLVKFGINHAHVVVISPTWKKIEHIYSKGTTIWPLADAKAVTYAGCGKQNVLESRFSWRGLSFSSRNRHSWETNEAIQVIILSLWEHFSKLFSLNTKASLNLLQISVTEIKVSVLGRHQHGSSHLHVILVIDKPFCVCSKANEIPLSSYLQRI